MYNPFSLQNKKILITGASSGIGKTTAVECAKLGANLILVGRNKDRLTETLKATTSGSMIVPADLTKTEDIENLIQNISEIDGAVFCAGIGNVVPFKMATRKWFNPIFETNYFSTVELFRRIVKDKKIKCGASVVFVSSIGGNYSITKGNCIYGASKAALNSTMKFCALELAPQKIRVNSVCPGMVNTNLIKDGAVSEEQHKADMEKYPLKRYGEPEDVAYGIIYLLSDASAWVTGHSLVIDGGITI